MSLNHPLAANLREAGELCREFNMCSWPWRHFVSRFRRLRMAERARELVTSRQGTLTVEAAREGLAVDLLFPAVAPKSPLATPAV